MRNYKRVNREEILQSSDVPKKLVIDEENITHEGLITKHFNNCFAQIGTNLAKTIEASSIQFEKFLKKCDSIQIESPLSVNELKGELFLLKINKSLGYDDISFNAVRNCFGPLLKPLMHIFDLSLEKGIFPDYLKIAWVSPIFKPGDKNEMRNYKPISVLPSFSKILERIMYNRFCKYLTANERRY